MSNTCLLKCISKARASVTGNDMSINCKLHLFLYTRFTSENFLLHVTYPSHVLYLYSNYIPALWWNVVKIIHVKYGTKQFLKWHVSGMYPVHRNLNYKRFFLPFLLLLQYALVVQVPDLVLWLWPPNAVELALVHAVELVLVQAVDLGSLAVELGHLHTGKLGPLHAVELDFVLALPIQ